MDIKVMDMTECIVVTAGIMGTVECTKDFSIRNHSTTGCQVAHVNRLIVKPMHRNKGVAKNLLHNLCELADHKAYELELTINAYGDLDAYQLSSLYGRYGFIEEDEGIFVRYPKGW